MGRVWIAAPVLALAVSALAAGGAGAQTQGSAFEPVTASEPVYGKSERPDLVERVPVGDGESVEVEVWLPQSAPGHPRPSRVPVVLVATPYRNKVVSGAEAHGQSGVPDHYVRRGYAVALGHVYATGESDGCWQHGGPREVHATLAMIELLGRARWSSGRVGMRGASYTASTQLAAAASDDPRARYLKAIVPISGLSGMYDGSVVGDGVPAAINGPGVQGVYVGQSLVPYGDGIDPGRVGARSTCARANVLSAGRLTLSGDFGRYWQRREYRAGVRRIKAATLATFGFRDAEVSPLTSVGFWERIPTSTPHKLVLGQWGHGEAARRGRRDFERLVQSWFDHFLLRHDTGAEEWPAVQVQELSRQWRAEPSWPAVDGAAGQLALGRGTLGETAPSGSTTFLEAAPGPLPVAPPARPVLDALPSEPSAGAAFVTEPLRGPLHVTGMPVLDLWVRLSAPDAHLMARLDVIGPDDRVAVTGATRRVPIPPVYGGRSLRHLEPLADDYFHQAEGRPAPVGEPVRVPIRLQPTDLTVAAGQRLRLILHGAGAGDPPAVPSGRGGPVEILHACDGRVSVLRFSMPAASPELLHVRQPEDGDGPLASTPSPRREVDGGALARRDVCGAPPVDPLEVARGRG